MQKNAIKAVLAALIFMNSCLFAAVSDANRLFQDGEQAMKNNNLEKAVSSFAQAVKIAPQDIRSRFRYGQTLYSLNRYNESFTQFQSILENSPNNIIARVYLCENLIKLGRSAEARGHLEWILKVQPGHERAAELLSETSGRENVPQGFKPLPVKDVSMNVAEIEKVEAPVEKKPAQKSGRAVKGKTGAETKGSVPPNAVQSPTWDVATFIKNNPESFVVNLEYGRYGIEKGDLKSARQYLNKAERLAKNLQDTRRFLEVQILNSLVYVYSSDFTSFGRHLMKLKPLLSEKSYQSFLDIYNQARELKSDVELARLAAGVAMGAGHYAVAADLLQKALRGNPGDVLLSNLLAEAQMQNLDYKGAEATLSALAGADQKNADSYFNLGRFYLTAIYRPETARQCAEYAASLRPEDPRIRVLLALLDYSEGRIETGIARLQQLLPQIEDPGFRAVCQKIIEDGKFADNSSGANRVDFVQVMALPGSDHAPKSSFRMVAEDYLKSGSFFSAMRYYMMAQDLAEVGRTYLGLSSALHLSGDARSAAAAAGFGLKALHEELSRNPDSGRANLYLALYHFERNDQLKATQAVRRGLMNETERSTRQRLTSLLQSMEQPQKN